MALMQRGFDGEAQDMKAWERDSDGKVKAWLRPKTVNAMWPLEYCGGWTVNRRGETVMAYDQKCLDLAEHFLKDTETESETQYKVMCDALATVIQATIEDWLNQVEPDKPQGPEAA